MQFDSANKADMEDDVAEDVGGDDLTTLHYQNINFSS